MKQSDRDELHTDSAMHAAQLLQILRTVNEMFLNEQNASRLIKETCRLVPQTLGFENAWIMLVDDENKCTNFADKGCTISGVEFQKKYNQGEHIFCIHQAAKKEKTVSIPMGQKDCDDCPMLHDKNSANAYIAPLNYKNRQHGFMCVTAQPELFKDAGKLALLDEITFQLSCALNRLNGSTFNLIKDKGTATQREAEQTNQKNQQAQASLQAEKITNTALKNQLPGHDERFQNAFHTSPDAISITRLQDGLYIDINEAFTRITGFTRTDLLGKSSISLGIWQDLETRTKIIERLTKHGRVTNIKAEFRKKNGDTVIGLTSASLLDIQGVPHILSITKDIDNDLKTQDALQQAVQQYRHLTEQSHDAIYLLYDNKFETINPRFEELFGYTLDECNKPDFHFMNLVAEESKPIIKERIRKFTAGEKVDPVYEFSAISKSGSIIKCEASVSRFSYKSGVATQGILRDIGARKKAEEESRKLLQAVEQSPTAVLITDLQGKIEYANPQFTVMTGYTFDELKGKPPQILQPETTPENIVNYIWDTVAEGNIWTGELQNIRKNGQFYWEKISISPIFNAGHLITHCIYIGEDITDKKELEEQLRQSQKMEAIGQLAGGVAHDFNNLLTIINGYSEILLAGINEDNPIYNGINQIKQAGIRAESLTRQLLAFSRKQIMQPQILDINDLVHNMERMLSRLIGEDIDLLTIYEPNLHKVKVDPGQFEQVILNLAINARDAMPIGGTLTIATRNKFLEEKNSLLHSNTPAGNYVQVIVSDTGQGMDKETLERIFEPFYTTKCKGTGLGLSTVYGIMKQSGGMTTVESEEGKGAIFRLYFPTIRETPADESETTTIEDEQRSHETILIAEDEDSVRELATLALQRVGFNVLAAENGLEAIELIKQFDGTIDLLLTDVIMPKMGGKELVVTAREHYPELKALYMSGYTDDSIVHHGVLEENTEFLQKPFTPDRLIRKIRRIINDSDPKQHH